MNSSTFSIPSTVSRSQDPRELEEWSASDGWELQYLPLKPRTFEASFQSRYLPRTFIQQEHWSARIQLRGTIRRDVVPIAIPIEGHGIFQGLPFHSNDLIFMQPNSELDLLAQSQTKVSTLHVFQDDLECVAGKVGIENPTTLLSDSTVVDFAPSFRQDFLKAMLEIVQIPASCPMALRELESQMLVSFLESLHKQNECKGRLEASLPARVRYVKRAQEFIEEHLDQTIHLEDLIAASGSSARTLQLYFREYFQMSPLEYLQLRRLHLSRRALQKASPDSTTVTQVAFSLGFSQMGRFSQRYAHMFGELPSITLRSQQRQFDFATRT